MSIVNMKRRIDWVDSLIQFGRDPLQRLVTYNLSEKIVDNLLLLKIIELYLIHTYRQGLL